MEHTTTLVAPHATAGPRTKELYLSDAERIARLSPEELQEHEALVRRANVLRVDRTAICWTITDPTLLEVTDDEAPTARRTRTSGCSDFLCGRKQLPAEADEDRGERAREAPASAPRQS